MMPNYKIDIVQTLNPKLLRMPPKSVINSEDGLVSNQHYVNPTYYLWEDCANILPYEEAAIMSAKKAETINEFLEILNEEENNVDCCTLADLGVSGTAIALVNLGYMQNKKGVFQYQCIPMTSWKGSSELTPRNENDTGFYPHVAGFATPQCGLELLTLVKDKNMGLKNVEFFEGPGFVIYAQNIEDMFNFGKFLYAQRQA